jgi:hypothetical protein
MSDPRSLSQPDRDRLAVLEDVIATGLDAFLQVGRALGEIRDSRLYREVHGTFEGYCHTVWGFGRKNAHDLIRTASVAARVQDLGHSAPTREQARALVPLAYDPDALAAIVEQFTPSTTAREARQAWRTTWAGGQLPCGTSTQSSLRASLLCGTSTQRSHRSSALCATGVIPISPHGSGKWLPGRSSRSERASSSGGSSGIS